VKEFTLPKLWHHQLENSFDELELLGFTLSSPFSLLKDLPPSQLVSADLPDRIGEKIRIVGYLITRKNTKTNSGKRMGFGVFLDLNGQWLDSIHFPEVLERFPFRGPGCYLITGLVTEEFGFITIETQELQRLENQNIEIPSTRLGAGKSQQIDP
jgi:DNA polymerase-3 subunit alpha